MAEPVALAYQPAAAAAASAGIRVHGAAAGDVRVPRRAAGLCQLEWCDVLHVSRGAWGNDVPILALVSASTPGFANIHCTQSSHDFAAVSR